MPERDSDLRIQAGEWTDGAGTHVARRATSWASTSNFAVVAVAVVVVVIAAVTSVLLQPGEKPGVTPVAEKTAAVAATASPSADPRPTAVPDSIQHQPENPGRYVNITIDDGPNPVWTPQVLEVLKEHNVHATFCMIGPAAKANPDLVRRVVAEGHRLCDHTVDHDTSMDHKPFSYQKSQILDALDMIKDASGGAPVPYYRAPGGAFTPASRALAAQHGMRPLGWNVDTKDYEQPGVTAIVDTVKNEIANGPTILFHDGGGDRSQTVQALDQALTWLSAQGYGFSFPKID